MGEEKEPQQEIFRYRWVVLGSWLLSGVACFMVVSTFGLLLPSISSELHLTPGQQGLLGSAAFWGNLTLAIPLSWWTSRYPAKMLTTVTLILGILLLLLQSWAPGFAYLIVGRLGFGISLLARLPARTLLTRQWFPQRETVLVNSLGNAMFGVITGGGLIATPFILNYLEDDWRTTLRFLSILIIVLTILWITLGREKEIFGDSTNLSQGGAGSIKGALGHRDLWIAGFAFFGTGVSWAAFLSFFPTLMLDTYGISLQWSGIVLALGILAGGVSGLGIGYVAMTTGHRKPILQVLGVLMVCTYAGMTMTSSLTLLLALSVLNGVAQGFWPVLYTVPFQLPGIRSRDVGIALSLIMMMVSAGTVVGPLATGLLQEALGTLKVALLIVSFFSIALSVSGTFLRRT